MAFKIPIPLGIMNQEDGKEHSHEGRHGYQGFQIFFRMKVADGDEKAKGLRGGGK